MTTPASPPVIAEFGCVVALLTFVAILYRWRQQDLKYSVLQAAHDEHLLARAASAAPPPLNASFQGLHRTRSFEHVAPSKPFDSSMGCSARSLSGAQGGAERQELTKESRQEMRRRFILGTEASPGYSHSDGPDGDTPLRLERGISEDSRRAEVHRRSSSSAVVKPSSNLGDSVRRRRMGMGASNLNVVVDCAPAPSPTVSSRSPLHVVSKVSSASRSPVSSASRYTAHVLKQRRNSREDSF